MARGLGRFLRQNTIAMLALFVALGGTTYAATALPKNSVGTKQIKNNAVISAKIKANAVTGAKVKDDSLTGTDVLESSLGKVPSASTADNATHATTADNATHATSADGAAPTGAASGALSGSYPNPSIATSTRGVALAGMETPGGSSPSVGVWFNRFGGVPTITRTGTGTYTVTFPGIAANVTTNVIASGNGPNDDQVSISSGSGSLFVSVLNGAGTAVDDYFSLVIYGASTSG
jgi:hypothetical protein